MNIDIKHKHAGHFIKIEGNAFKADDMGRWDLTDIWRTLALPKTKGPGKWVELKEAQRLKESRKVELSHGNGTWATKQAAIRYAAWVSPEFEDVVFDAFEAVLEMPEVATLIAEKMAQLGHSHSADIVKRMVFNDRCDWKTLKKARKVHQKSSQKGLAAAVKKGNLTPARATELGWKGRQSIL